MQNHKYRHSAFWWALNEAWSILLKCYISFLMEFHGNHHIPYLPRQKFSDAFGSPPVLGMARPLHAEFLANACKVEVWGQSWALHIPVLCRVESPRGKSGSCLPWICAWKRVLCSCSGFCNLCHAFERNIIEVAASAEKLLVLVCPWMVGLVFGSQKLKWDISHFMILSVEKSF